MLKQQNSTGATGNATELTCAAPVAAIDAIANDIEKRDGLLARAQASKQLCAVLLDQFERQLAWDRGEPTFRHLLCEDYKATRERMEEKGLKPRDMLDVRDFMWLSLKPAGRNRIMEMRQEARLDEPVLPQEERETEAA